MPFFDTARAEELDAFLGDNHSSEYPDTLKVALFLTVPSGTNPGTQPAGGYLPVLVDNDSTTWPDADTALHRKSNGVPFVFPTATSNWGTVNGYGLLRPDDSVLWYSGLTTPVSVLSGQTRQFAVGTFILVGF